MRLKFQPQGEFKTGAGQYFYVKVPSVDRIWHPFTLASASNDRTLQAHIGIIAGKNDWIKSKGGELGAKWESRNRTWTYKLFEQVSKRGGSTIPAQVRGPYGCSFNGCFDPAYQAAVVVAAGTGLSAAESVLRETLERRKAGIPGPQKLWVVYSCREEDSLIWCWERIVSLLVKAVEDRVLDIDKLSPRSSVFDWIGIQMYVTQSTPELMKQFNKLNREQGNKVFNLRESIFNRNTIRTGGNGQVSPAGAIKDVAAMGPAGQGRRGSGGSGFSGLSGGSGGSGGYYGMPGYPAGPRGDIEAGGYGGQLQGMRGAAQAIARGNYTDLQMGGSREGVAGKVREWLLSRVLAGSLDDEDTHIERFLYGALESFGEQSAGKMSVGFCGPGPLALTISEACGFVQAAKGVTVDFVAESQ
jgi:hypothetical protein